MADRQWVGWSGQTVHEEGVEEFVTWAGAVISEDQAVVAATFPIELIKRDVNTLLRM